MAIERATAPFTVSRPVPDRNLLNVFRADERTAEQKSELAKTLTDTLMPAVEKWIKAYEAHISFRPEDLTPDKFTGAWGRIRHSTYTHSR